MNFQGWLLKVNGNIIPLSFILLNTYKTIPNRQQDNDDTYVDPDGYLNRNVLPHTRSTIEFSTPAIWLTDKLILQSLIPNRTKATMQYWNDESNTYETGEFYIPDVTYEVLKIVGNNIQYLPIAYKFIEY